jgi:hypothetical protein
MATQSSSLLIPTKFLSISFLLQTNLHKTFVHLPNSFFQFTWYSYAFLFPSLTLVDYCCILKAWDWKFPFFLYSQKLDTRGMTCSPKKQLKNVYWAPSMDPLIYTMFHHLNSRFWRLSNKIIQDCTANKNWSTNSKMLPSGDKPASYVVQHITLQDVYMIKRAYIVTLNR